MIKFNFTMPSRDNSKMKRILYQNEYKYPDIIEISGDFQILLNGNVFFSEPYFPVLEFLNAALSWIDCSDESKEMSYSSIEAEINPLIVFTRKEGGWVIRSPWQKYESMITFTKSQIANAILHFKKTLSEFNQ